MKLEYPAKNTVLHQVTGNFLTCPGLDLDFKLSVAGKNTVLHQVTGNSLT